MFDQARAALSNLRARFAPGAPGGAQQPMKTMSESAAASATARNPDSWRNELTPNLSDDRAVIAHVTNLYEMWHRARYPYEVAWYLDVAYYLGLQWHSWSETDRGLRESRAPSYRVRMIVNRIMPTIRTLLGKILRGAPVANVFPLQQGPQAYADSRMGRRLLRAQNTNLHLEETWAEWGLWASITGNGFVKVGFDPSIGEQVQLPDGSKVSTGEVCVDPCSPFSILVSPEISNLHTPHRIMHCQMVDIEILRSRYPDTAGNLKPDAGNRKENFYEQRLASLISPITQNHSMGRDDAHNAAYVVELWEDPEVLHPEDREQFPNGRVIVMAQAQSRLLSIHENPYRTWLPHESKNPFVMIRDDRVPGRFWGSSRIDQLMPAQKSYNKGRSQMIEARNLCTQPKLQLEQGHGIPRITNEPGQILERRRGFAPAQYLAPPQMSQYLVQDIEETKLDFQELSQMNEATRGQLPSANIPATAVNYLQEADNTPLAPFAKQVAAGFSSAYTKILERCHQFYDEERVVAYVGPRNESDVVEFLADRHITPLRAEVTVEMVMPESQASRDARVDRALERGVLDPVKDRSSILQLMEFGDIEQVWEESDLDRQKQTRENKAMLQGQPQVVADFDDHQAHLTIVNRFRKSPEWDGLDPQLQQLFTMHANGHMDALLRSVQNVANMPPVATPPHNPVAPQ